MVVVKVGFRPLGRPEMDKDGPNSFGLNQVTDPGDVVQSLAAKGAAKMTKENQQYPRLIHKLQKGSASFCPVLAEYRGHLRVLRIWIGRRQRHAHLRRWATVTL